MTSPLKTHKESEALLAGLEQLLAKPRKPVSIQEFWANSVSASVISDYAEGRTVDV